MDKLFQPVATGHLTLANRIVRSATFEGLCDDDGRPTKAYLDLYAALAGQHIGALLTGFAYVTPCGRAMQPGQAGIEDDAKIPLYKTMTGLVHARGGKVLMQIAHSGRQTSARAVGGWARGASSQSSAYFGVKVKALTTSEAWALAEGFATAALRCQKAGFDGVQIHAAHGYLVHQFLLPSINDRRDIFGIDRKTGIGPQFLKVIIERVRERCGYDFPLWVKISGDDQPQHGLEGAPLIHLVRFLDQMKVDAIEISCGTMERALNIFRGQTVPLDAIWRYNPKYKTASILGRLWRRYVLYPFMRPGIRLFSPMYNLAYARQAKQHTAIPIISVGGFRTGQEMSAAVERGATDMVGLSRPFISEPDLVDQLIADHGWKAKCLNCNRCAVMTDSHQPTRCYRAADV